MQNKRIYYVDWLRVMVILSLIPYHSALTYIKYGSVYIKAPLSGQAQLPFVVITTVFSDFFMTLLFFLSGIASFYSFRRRSKEQYKKERRAKLLYPLLLGTLFLCPIQGYLKAVYIGNPVDFLHFLPQFFYFKLFDYYAYSHLWFLLYLFIFSMVCIPLFTKLKKQEKLSEISSFMTKGNRILLPVVFIILTELLLRPFFHESQSFINDWANVIVYLSVFIFGYLYAAEQRLQVRVKELWKPAAIAALFSLAVLMLLNYEWNIMNSEQVYLIVLWGPARGLYECSMIIFLMGLGQKYLNREGRILTYLSKASFTIYLFHFLPLTFFTLRMLPVKMNVYLKYLLVVFLSYLTVLIINEIKVRLERV